MKLTFEDIREKGLLLYEYVRGSRCHGIETETSDWDYGGVYLAPNEQLLGLGLDYQATIENSTHDIVWYELNRFMELLLKSNPTMIESLFIDDEFVIYEHPIITEIKKHRNEFISKKCFPSFYGYAVEQIKKARGLNKKIVNPITERKGVIDFCYAFYNQGSMPMSEWLNRNGLEQRYCGLVNIPNMRSNYSVFYDWGNHFQEKGITVDELIYNEKYLQLYNSFVKYILNDRLLPSDEEIEIEYEKLKPIGYRGIIGVEGNESNDVRLSSVLKGAEPICFLNYNKDGYVSHCRRYKEYKDWEEKRNKIRYESNLDKNYDSKNVCECFRLIHMGNEIASGDGVKVNRKGIDRDFLLDIKAHKYEYDYLIDLVEKEKQKMDISMQNSSLPDDIDTSKIDKLLIHTRENI